ncbi:hypothetical protein JYA63_08060 [Fictibacillus nanhaiensis]|uniref:Uncharacterized protein n=1 Tax=Fictibacillus nanhaiensis TaxID=742169 RepID=A0ABS2ZMY1_9BACL|nr:hypothetical protein [Fictibacillus nanhaiensis]
METDELIKIVKELLDNLIIRIEQINSMFINGENKEVKGRLIYLLDDLDTLVQGFSKLETIIDNSELNYILNSLAENIENKEEYLVNDILTYELSPILQHWRGII